MPLLFLIYHKFTHEHPPFKLPPSLHLVLWGELCTLARLNVKPLRRVHSPGCSANESSPRSESDGTYRSVNPTDEDDGHPDCRCETRVITVNDPLYESTKHHLNESTGDPVLCGKSLHQCTGQARLVYPLLSGKCRSTCPVPSNLVAERQFEF